ncbi:MAG: molybdopterin-dependent oxidoreductase, partial [Pseudomonadota bacterium]
RNRGAKLVVVDPYNTPTAKKADMHLMLRPGTDGALACAVMHVLFRDGHVDRDYLRDFTDASPEFERHLDARSPDWAAKITGLTVAEIEAFAALYGQTKRSFLRVGYGFSRSRNGAVNVHAVTCLPAITGAWRHKGGGALYGNTMLYNVDQSVIKGLDRVPADTRVMDQSRIGDVLTGNPEDLQGGPPVTVLFVQNTNPLVVAPETLKVKKGFERDDLFVCVHEQFMTETAAMADIVLPATMFLEHDDLYQASGHTFLQTTRKVVEAPGECRSNHWVLNELAARLGIDHPGFSMTEHELIERTLSDSGLPGEAEMYEKHWHDCADDFSGSNFLNGFHTPDGRFHFKPDWSRVGPHAEGLPSFPDHWSTIDAASDEFPYRLVAAPARKFLNTTFTETPSSQKKEGRPTVLIHPSDCANLGIAEGDRVSVANALAEIVLHAKVFEGLQPGTVVVESIWPNSAFEGELGVNALVSAEPGKPNGGAVFHDTAVSIRSAR